MKSLNKIAVLGDKEFALPFRAIGAEIFETLSSVAVSQLLKEVIEKEEFAIIIIDEKIAMQVSDVIEKTRMLTYPIILTLPNGFENLNLGQEKINQNMEKVIGKNLNKESKV